MFASPVKLKSDATGADLKCLLADLKSDANGDALFTPAELARWPACVDAKLLLRAQATDMWNDIFETLSEYDIIVKGESKMKLKNLANTSARKLEKLERDETLAREKSAQPAGEGGPQHKRAAPPLGRAGRARGPPTSESQRVSSLVVVAGRSSLLCESKAVGMDITEEGPLQATKNVILPSLSLPVQNIDTDSKVALLNIDANTTACFTLLPSDGFFCTMDVGDTTIDGTAGLQMTKTLRSSLTPPAIDKPAPIMVALGVSPEGDDDAPALLLPPNLWRADLMTLDDGSLVIDEFSLVHATHVNAAALHARAFEIGRYTAGEIARANNTMTSTMITREVRAMARSGGRPLAKFDPPPEQLSRVFEQMSGEFVDGHLTICVLTHTMLSPLDVARLKEVIGALVARKLFVGIIQVTPTWEEVSDDDDGAGRQSELQLDELKLALERVGMLIDMLHVDDSLITCDASAPVISKLSEMLKS